MTIASTETISAYTDSLAKGSAFVSVTTLKTDYSSLNEFSPIPAKTYYKLPVDSFIWEEQKHSVSPQLLFKYRLDEETGLYEIVGESPYEDLFVYGEKINDAIDILRKEILPILWEDSLNQDKAKLSEKAKSMAADLERRVEYYASENEGS